MKKLFIFGVMLLTALSASSVLGAEGEFEFDAQKGMITAYTGDAEYVEIPREIDGVEVKSISSHIFALSPNKEGIKYISIPETVEEVWQNDLNEYGNVTFGGLSSLEAINVNDQNPAFYSMDGMLFENGGKLFWYPQAKEENYIIIGDYVNEIAPYAFSEAKRIKDIYFKNCDVSAGIWSFGMAPEITLHCPEDSVIGEYAKSVGVPYLDRKIGDANDDGELTAADSAVILQKVLNSSYEAPIEKRTSFYKIYLDTNGDRDITAGDSALVMQKVLNPSTQMANER